MQIVILEADSVGKDISIDCYQKLGQVRIYPATAYEEIPERIKDADIIIVNKSKLDEGSLKGAANLKLICFWATGYDSVDLEYCKRKGIKVANVAGYSTDAVSQHTFAMALYLSEHLPYYDHFVKSGAYASSGKFSHFAKSFPELSGKTWGIIGMGTIGRQVAKIADAFGCRVIFHSVTGKSSITRYPQVSFEELLTQSDFLSLHCPLSDLTRDLIDKDALRKMKKTAILLNVARGPVVNNQDLYEALVEGEIAAAGLDVVEVEPIQPENPLSKLADSDRLLITPHMAWASTEARNRIVQEEYLNIEAFLQGKERNIVN